MTTTTSTPGASDPLPFPAPRGGCPFAPAPAYETARDELPLTQVTLYDGRKAWLITRHADARFVLSDPRFSADVRTPGFPMANERQRFLLQGEPSFVRMDAPEHTRQRGMLTKWFTARRIREMRPKIQSFADARIDRIAPRGQAELVEEFALPLSSLVICDILGVPYEDHAYFERTSQAMLRWNATQDETLAAWTDLHDYLQRLAVSKLRTPDDRVVSLLVERADLTHSEVASMCRTLLVAGHDTTAEAIAMSVAALLREPEKAAELRAHPERYAEAAAELLRYLSPVGHHGVGRVATEDVVIDGRTIRAGEGALVVLPAANRDGRVWENAGELLGGEPGSTASHIALGYGPHYCLGASLARLEIEIALETLFRRLPRLRLAVPFEELAFREPASVHGLKELPVRW
ncbi:cytochrome P450 [Streptomyces lunalinharesii]